MDKKLKKGYTTGVHTSFAFKSALEVFLATKELSISKTIKIDNDDLDVTKRCEIFVTISSNIEKLNINSISHKPYILQNNQNILKLYAGYGVGIVTKDGLKPKKNYPAINPTPLKALRNIFNNLTKNIDNLTLYCTVSVTDGQKIAKKTANEKVGIFGGISILGTTGWVKPISSSAYIDTIKTELIYAKANNYKKIVFTLGNSSLEYARQYYKDSYIIEIGNFIYDGIKLAVSNNFEHIILICGIGKGVKISQGFKNTHNRFGSIDFKQLQKQVDVDISNCISVKKVCELLDDKNKEFYDKISNKIEEKFIYWFNKNDIKIVIL